MASIRGAMRAQVERPEPPAIINDVTQLNPIPVGRIIQPTTIEEIVEAVRTSDGPISVGGGRYSMGGQTAVENGLQIDMRSYNKVVAFDSIGRTITVQAGMRWRDIQERIDPANLSIKIMQTYSNFTVGGSLSVNVHGRYIGLGPLILSVRAIRLVLADGSEVEASPTVNPELFYGAIGGYGGIGVITQATLELSENVRVKRHDRRMPLAEYHAWFKRAIRDSSAVIFHNADIYPAEYSEVNAVTFERTDDSVTVAERLIPRDKSYRLNRFVYWVISEWPGGKWLRQHVVDPLIYRNEPVSWRNNEASYDVADLEPSSRESSSYVLQEYFIPVDSLMQFVPKMRDIFNTHEVNVINVSIRHALPDPGSLLAWARGEVFAFVVYYKQDTDDVSRRAVGTWTRELIDAAIASGGAYYLPYQPVATPSQFARAYPRSPEYFALKKRVDPDNRFRNTLWDTYYTPTVAPTGASLTPDQRVAVDTMAGYRRDEGQTFLTHPEWYIVYASEEYGEWMRTRLPTDFPYLASMGQFWVSYAEARRETENQYPFNFGYHAMLWVIGSSYSLELTLKALYENTIGRFTGWTANHELTEEDRFAADVAVDYGRYIHDVPWYVYPFGARLKGLWTDVPLWGTHPIRKWERRFFLTLEYGIKAAYAAIIGFGTKTAYTPQADRMLMVVTGWNDSLPHEGVTPIRAITPVHTLLSTPRYDGFMRAATSLATSPHPVTITEVAGNDDILVTGLAPKNWSWSMPGARILYALPLPSDPERKRIVMQVRVRALVPLLGALMRQRGFAIDHVYDY